MTTLAELTDEIRRTERVLAPGSETSLWGDYCSDMLRVTGHLPYTDTDDDPTLPDQVVEYWRAEYRSMAMRKPNMGRPPLTPESLRTWRAAEDLSQAVASELAGVALRAWQRWESTGNDRRAIPQWLHDTLLIRHGTAP